MLKYKNLSISLYESLKDDPFFNFLKRKIKAAESTKLEVMLRYMNFSIEDAFKYGKVGQIGEENYGASLWSIPLKGEKALKRKEEKEIGFKSIFGEKAYAELYEVSKSMTELNNKFITEDMWYLSILGIHPDYQNKGLGRKLVEPILVEADTLKIPTYLETFTPQNNSFYKRLGYQVVANIHEPIIGADYNLMVRDI